LPPLTPRRLCTTYSFTPRETDEGNRTGSVCHPCFLRSKIGSWEFQKVGSPIPRHESKRAIRQMWRSNFAVGRLVRAVLQTSLIPRRVIGCRHNLRMFLNFGASAPGSSPQKTGAPTRIGAAAFSFEWIVSGLTVVSFWTAPAVPPCAGILALELRSGYPAPAGNRASGAQSGAIESE
jgi:hypothetical protein